MYNRKHNHRPGPSVPETFWMVFMLLLPTSFYWWGRINLGVLQIPWAVLLIPVVAFYWICSLPFRLPAARNDVIKLSIPLLIILWGALFSVLNSDTLDTAIGVLLEMTFYIALFVLMTQTLQSVAALKRLTLLLIAGVSFLMLEGLYRFFVTKSLWRLGAGTIHTATNMGAFVFQAVILLLVAKIVFDSAQSKPGRIFYAILLLVFLVGFAFTYSRGAWLTVFIGLAVLVFYRKMLSVPILVGLLVLLPIVPAAISSRLNSMLDFAPNSTVALIAKNEFYRSIEIKNTTHLRLQNWLDSLNTIARHPVFGLGIGHYHGESREKGERAPHNAYLRIWAESGSIAMTGFLWFLYSLCRSLFQSVRQAPQEKWILLGFLAVFVTHIFYMLLGDWPYQMYFWVLAALATASSRILPGQTKPDANALSVDRGKLS